MDSAADAPTLASAPSTAGGPRAVIEDAIAASLANEPAVLALVVETDGSTYVGQGALALFGASRQSGWLSGGCLEPEIEAHARRAAERGTIGWIEVDTREDAALFSGTAPGCRGRLRIALLPMRALDGFATMARRWLDGEGALRWRIEANGRVAASVASHEVRWTPGGEPPAWSESAADAWAFEQPSPPSVLVLGAGPEAPLLLPLLRRLGCVVVAVEQRPRWRASAALADVAIALAPAAAIAQLRARRFDAALVMHHGFELDRDALEALSGTDIAYVGLLGPRRRRDDLFRLLPDAARAALAPRLRSPIGLDLGGRGPEAIALSIAAQLQTHFHPA